MSGFLKNVVREQAFKGSLMEQTACEDLKAFERRLMEVVTQMQPSASKWRGLLLLVSVCASIGAYQWLTDPITKEVSFSYSLYNHLFFTVSLFLLLLLFFCGIHKRVVAPSIISSRCRQCLADFNMSCDDTFEFSEVATTASVCMDEWQRYDFMQIFNTTVFVVATVALVCGGVIPYYFQHREIRRTQNAKGFSLFVCLNLLASNVLRIMFWFGKHFEIQLLIQSLIMIVCMMTMIEVSVRINRRQTLPPSRHYTVSDGDFVSHFWAWSDFSSYLIVTAGFTAVSLVVTYALLEYSWYIETIGFLALFLEANLGSPQFVANWQRKSTKGMSVSMVMLWLIGDISKTIYFVVRKTPSQFWLCGTLQVGIDIAILSQILFYRKNHPEPKV